MRLRSLRTYACTYMCQSVKRSAGLLGVRGGCNCPLQEDREQIKSQKFAESWYFGLGWAGLDLCCFVSAYILYVCMYMPCFGVIWEVGGGGCMQDAICTCLSLLSLFFFFILSA